MREKYDSHETIEPMSGKGFGDVLYWKLDSQGSLRISGKGKLPDYSCGKNPDAPWHDRKQLIKEIIIEDGVTELGAKAFEACENLEAITLPESLCRIRYYCFRGCHKLERVAAPWNVKYKHVYEPEEEEEEKRKPGTFFKSKETIITLGLHAFTGTPWAVKKWGDYYIKNGILIDYLQECDSAVIPEGIRDIGVFAFMNAQIKAVKFPEGLECVAQGAFKNTLIEEVQMPHSLKRVEHGAFAGSALSRVIFLYGNEAEIDTSAFMDTDIQFLGHLRDLYELNLKTWDRNSKEYKRIAVQKRNKIAGTNILNAGVSILRRIKRGAVIIGIKWDDAAKKIINVRSFVWDALYEQPQEYLMYPCYENESDRREASIWKNSAIHVKEEEIINNFFSEAPEGLVNGSGIRVTADKDKQEEWFYSRDVKNFAGTLEFELLKKWMERNPAYTLKSREENAEDEKYRQFMEC